MTLLDPCLFDLLVRISFDRNTVLFIEPASKVDPAAAFGAKRHRNCEFRIKRMLADGATNRGHDLLPGNQSAQAPDLVSVVVSVDSLLPLLSLSDFASEVLDSLAFLSASAAFL